MNKLADYKLLRVLKFSTNVMWYLSIPVLSIAVIMLLVLLVFNPEGFQQKDFYIPVTVCGEISPIQVDSSDPSFSNLRIEPGSGSLAVRGSKPYLLGLMWLVVIIWLAVLAYIVYNLKSVFNNLSSGNPFERKNIVYIRNIGFTLLAGELVVWLIFFIINLIYKESFTLSAGKMDMGTNPNIVTIFTGLIILVIAEIFRTGAILREEQELTI